MDDILGFLIIFILLAITVWTIVYAGINIIKAIKKRDFGYASLITIMASFPFIVILLVIYHTTTGGR